jgi:hypothetical protein
MKRKAFIEDNQQFQCAKTHKSQLLTIDFGSAWRGGKVMKFTGNRGVSHYEETVRCA